MFKVSKSGHPSISAVRQISKTEPETLKRNLGFTQKSKNSKGVDSRFESTSNVNMRVTGSPNTTISGNAITIDVDPMLTGMTPQTEHVLHSVFRDIYYNDSVAGSAVDLISMLPFGEFSLGGFPALKGDTKKVHTSYMETIERLNTRTMLPEISIDYLVLGEHCSSLLYNKDKKVFTDVLPHKAEDLKIEALPFYSQKPIITATFPAELKEILSRNTPRVNKIREMLGADIVEKIKAGSLELDPLSTIYIPRRTFSHSARGTSYFRRLLPIYLIEKNLFRGTLVESARRQRGILHLSLGDGDQWIPSVQDMEFMTELFMNADSDPIGAIIATRSGVQVDELRQGGDFWKSTDFADSVLSHKLRALSISEGFLSGDANYDCVIGSTFVQTKQGLLKIGEIADKKDGKVQDFTTKVNSRYGIENCAKWVYSSVAPVIEVTTSNGSEVTGTPKHKLLKLSTDNLEQDWSRLDKLRIGDWLALQTTKCVRTSKLKLDLSPTPPQTKGLSGNAGVWKQAIAPKHMSPSLAYIMGCVLAEGTIYGGRVIFYNSDIAFIERYEQCVKEVFGIECVRHLRAVAGTKMVINGVKTQQTKDSYKVDFTALAVAEWLQELGMTKGNAYTKGFPWSILQADEESQLAFLAAYIEGDGYTGHRISISSRSKEIRDSMFAIIQSHGFNVNHRKFVVDLPAIDSYNLYQKIEKYLVHKYEFSIDHKAANGFFIPFEEISSMLADRKIKHDRYGAYFYNDDGVEINIRGYKKFADKNFLYDAYDAGRYDVFMSHLKLISISTFKNLQNLLKYRYRYVQVVSLSQKDKQPVYDLSMPVGKEPAYVANGFISHNTSGNAITVFLDMIRSFREMMTRKLFYDTLFPLISLVNGFTLKGNLLKLDPNLISRLDNEEALGTLNDGSKLFIPSVHWTKQLKPEGDSAYLDMLQALTDKGVPVPLRALAAAGGLDLDTLVRQQDEDLDIRKRVSDYLKKISDLAPAPPEGADEETSESSDRLLKLASPNLGSTTRSLVLANTGKVALLNRDFSHVEPYKLSKTGKPKHVFNRRTFESQANENIMKAIRTVKGPRK